MNKFCVNCGNSLESGSAFCTNCGTKVEPINELSNNTDTTIDNQVNLSQEISQNNNQVNLNQEVVHNHNQVNEDQNIIYSQNNGMNSNLNQSVNTNQFNYNPNNNVNNGNNNNDHKGLKIASLVLGIIAIVGSFFVNLLVIPLAIVGLILGIVYSAKVKKVCAGIFLNIAGFVLPIIILIIAFFAFGSFLEDSFNEIWSDTDYYSSYDNYYSDDYNDYFTDNTDDTTNTEFQRVGNEEYGYIDVPSNWSKFYDVSGTKALQYSYANIWIMTMMYFDDLNVTVQQYADILLGVLDDDGCLYTSSEAVKVGKYDAYKVSGYYSTENLWLVTWCFLDENGRLHYIAVEGPDQESEHYDLINTFSLEK